MKLCADCKHYREHRSYHEHSGWQVIQACHALPRSKNAVSGMPIEYVECTIMRMVPICGFDGQLWEKANDG